MHKCYKRGSWRKYFMTIHNILSQMAKIKQAAVCHTNYYYGICTSFQIFRTNTKQNSQQLNAIW